LVGANRLNERLEATDGGQPGLQVRCEHPNPLDSVLAAGSLMMDHHGLEAESGTAEENVA
jgi:hypothetical protein